MRRLLLLLAVSVFGVYAAAASAASRVTGSAGIVDITTRLTYQGAAAAGTGMVLTSTGEVLTNNHVIKGATSVRVYVPTTHRHYTAKVVGYSVANDVAVIQLEGASGLTTITAGNSATVKSGAPITAIGNAEGAGGTPATVNGSVTGLGKSITAVDDNGVPETLQGLIQTNAPIQPGDSGGALVNGSGQVVGMNTAASRSFQFQQGASQAFAIPIDHALAIVKEIMAGHSTATVHVGSTPFLGISVEIPRFATSTSGLLVGSIVRSGPADRAGLQVQSILKTLNGQTITAPRLLTTLLLRHKVGDKVTIGVIDPVGNRADLTVTLGNGPPQ